MRVRITQKILEQAIFGMFGLLIIALILAGVSFTTNYVAGANNATNRTVIAKVNVTNTEPNITAIRIDDDNPLPSNQIDLTANGVTVVTCNATVFDYNGWQDIMIANVTNATFFINSVGSNAADDNNSHYTNSSCGRCRQATSSEAHNGDTAHSAVCDCKFAVQYYANYSTTWTCEFTVRDSGGNQVSALEINLTDTESNSSGVTVTHLLAINTSAVLDYGNLSVTEESAEIVHNVTNGGNVPFNLTLRGFAGSEDLGPDDITYNLSMLCEYGNISIGSQRYEIGSDRIGATNYDDMIHLTNQTVETNLTFPQRVDDANFGADRNSTVWKIQVPLSVGGLCNGTIIFGAIDASE
jgi:hypothetical protein